MFWKVLEVHHDNCPGNNHHCHHHLRLPLVTPEQQKETSFLKLCIEISKKYVHFQTQKTWPAIELKTTILKWGGGGCATFETIKTNA